MTEVKLTDKLRSDKLSLLKQNAKNGDIYGASGILVAQASKQASKQARLIFTKLLNFSPD